MTTPMQEALMMMEEQLQQPQHQQQYQQHQQQYQQDQHQHQPPTPPPPPPKVPQQIPSNDNLTPHEVLMLRQLLALNSDNAIYKSPLAVSGTTDSTDADSEYSEFPQSTHAWAVFADKTNRKATTTDRIVGTAIICFQLFTYSLFVVEAVSDYRTGSVPVTTTHDACLAHLQQGQQQFDDGSLTCEAGYTSHFDAFVAFFMLSIFLTPDILQAARAVVAAQPLTGTIFAIFAMIEVVYAFVAATVAISYQLFIGEVTDAIEVGVGLLFIRELSARAYQGIRHKGVKQYKAFFGMLSSLLLAGFLVEFLCESGFGPPGSGYTME